MSSSKFTRGNVIKGIATVAKETVVSSSKFTRRNVIKGIATVAAAGVLPSCMTDPQAGTGGIKPNFLFVYVDQLRQDALSIYGGRNVHTPHMDKFCNEGIRFTNAVANVPVCGASRSQLVTGLHPTHSGTVGNFLNVDTRQTSIAKLFNKAGYDTAFLGKWHLNAGQFGKGPLTVSSEEEANEATKNAWAGYRDNPQFGYVPPGPARMSFKHWEAYNFHVDFNNAWYFRDEPKKILMPDYETNSLADMTINYMKRQIESGEPFLAIMAPHPPHPPFRPDYMPEGYLDNVPQQLHWDPNVPKDHPRRADQLEARCYYGMVKNTDDNFGRLMAYLDASGLAQNTIVVLTADHGEMMGAQGTVNKMKPYREAMNVPMAIRWPGRISAGLVSDSLHTMTDYLATLCSLAGIAIPNNTDSHNFAPEALGQAPSHRDAVLIANYSGHWDYLVSSQNLRDFDIGIEFRGVKTKRYTYARFMEGGELLFDNREDPYQLRNLAEGKVTHHTELVKLRSRLRDLMHDYHDSWQWGDYYTAWYDKNRNVIANGRGVI